MYKRSLMAILMVLALPMAAYAEGLPAEPASLTLDVALAQALRHNPSIEAAEAKLAQAKIEKEQQDLWWARTMNANANYVVGDRYGTTAQGTTLPSAAVGIGFNLGDLLAGPKNSARAEQEVRIAQAELRKTSLEVASQVTAAYEAYAAAKQLASVSGDMMQAADADVRVAERQFSMGTSAINGLLGVRLAAQRVRVDSITAKGNVATAWSNLLNLMGGDEWLPRTDATQADRR